MTLPSAISARHLSLPLLKIAFATSTILASANIAHAQNSAPSQLPVVKPVTECSGLAAATPATVEGAGVTAQSKALTTAKGTFCHVTGIIAPSIGFEIDLPQDRWTQRFVESGCGGLCGMINASIGNASRCAPALNGEFVVAASDLGHKGKMGSPDEGAFAADPQKRIDFAYRANHLTAQYAQALIHTYYGQTPRYSYFSGCSDGGREALMEAQRYPQDFNGISAGAPAMLFQVQNSFYHAWGPTVNRRANGTAILLAGKLPVLHAAVIDHCDMLDGTRDGLLTDPRACHVRPEWVRCPTGAADTTRCLTPEEWRVVARLYEGPTDTAGHHFLPGGVQPGSEMGWDAFVPAEPNGRMMGVSMIRSMTPVVLQNPVPADSDAARYPFTTEQFSRVTALHPLNDATSTDLRAFAGNGGKLIMWHGWSDTSIAPMISVAYYKGVRNQMGAGPTDAFLRLFMLPGTEHCGGGDGFGQIDTLQALMTWVEAGKAPASITAGQVPARRGPLGGPPGGPPGGPVPGEDGKPSFGHVPTPGDMPPITGHMSSSAAPNGADGRGGGPRGAPPGGAPYAIAGQTALATRPIYPFPLIARYSGKGDPKSASSYVAAPGPVASEPTTISWYGSDLIAPDFQKNYTVKDGQLTTSTDAPK